MKETRPKVTTSLLFRVKELYPETEGMTFTGVVGWALRKLVSDADYVKEALKEAQKR